MSLLSGRRRTLGLDDQMIFCAKSHSSAIISPDPTVAKRGLFGDIHDRPLAWTDGTFT
jgi:hypothetical protein